MWLAVADLQGTKLWCGWGIAGMVELKVSKGRKKVQNDKNIKHHGFAGLHQPNY